MADIYVFLLSIVRFVLLFTTVIFCRITIEWAFCLYFDSHFICKTHELFCYFYTSPGIRYIKCQWHSVSEQWWSFRLISQREYSFDRNSTAISEFLFVILYARGSNWQIIGTCKLSVFAFFCRPSNFDYPHTQCKFAQIYSSRNAMSIKRNGLYIEGNLQSATKKPISFEKKANINEIESYSFLIKKTHC